MVTVCVVFQGQSALLVPTSGTPVFANGIPAAAAAIGLPHYLAGAQAGTGNMPPPGSSMGGMGPGGDGPLPPAAAAGMWNTSQTSKPLPQKSQEAGGGQGVDPKLVGDVRELGVKVDDACQQRPTDKLHCMTKLYVIPLSIVMFILLLAPIICRC